MDSRKLESSARVVGMELRAKPVRATQMRLPSHSTLLVGFSSEGKIRPSRSPGGRAWSLAEPRWSSKMVQDEPGEGVCSAGKAGRMDPIGVTVNELYERSDEQELAPDQLDTSTAWGRSNGSRLAQGESDERQRPATSSVWLHLIVALRGSRKVGDSSLRACTG